MNPFSSILDTDSAGLRDISEGLNRETIPLEDRVQLVRKGRKKLDDPEDQRKYTNRQVALGAGAGAGLGFGASLLPRVGSQLSSVYGSALRQSREESFADAITQGVEDLYKARKATLPSLEPNEGDRAYAKRRYSAADELFGELGRVEGLNRNLQGPELRSSMFEDIDEVRYRDAPYRTDPTDIRYPVSPEAKDYLDIRQGMTTKGRDIDLSKRQLKETILDYVRGNEARPSPLETKTRANRMTRMARALHNAGEKNVSKIRGLIGEDASDIVRKNVDKQTAFAMDQISGSTQIADATTTPSNLERKTKNISSRLNRVDRKYFSDLVTLPKKLKHFPLPVTKRGLFSLGTGVIGAGAGLLAGKKKLDEANASVDEKSDQDIREMIEKKDRERYQHRPAPEWDIHPPKKVLPVADVKDWSPFTNDPSKPGFTLRTFADAMGYTGAKGYFGEISELPEMAKMDPEGTMAQRERAARYATFEDRYGSITDAINGGD